MSGTIEDHPARLAYQDQSNARTQPAASTASRFALFPVNKSDTTVNQKYSTNVNVTNQQICNTQQTYHTHHTHHTHHTQHVTNVSKHYHVVSDPRASSQSENKIEPSTSQTPSSNVVTESELDFDKLCTHVVPDIEIQWYKIGLALGLTTNSLDSIDITVHRINQPDKHNQNDILYSHPKECMKQVLLHWMRGEHKIQELFNALKDDLVCLNTCAAELEKKYQTSPLFLNKEPNFSIPLKVKVNEDKDKDKIKDQSSSHESAVDVDKLMEQIKSADHFFQELKNANEQLAKSLEQTEIEFNKLKSKNLTLQKQHNVLQTEFSDQIQSKVKLQVAELAQKTKQEAEKSLRSEIEDKIEKTYQRKLELVEMKLIHSKILGILHSIVDNKVTPSDIRVKRIMDLLDRHEKVNAYKILLQRKPWNWGDSGTLFTRVQDYFFKRKNMRNSEFNRAIEHRHLHKMIKIQAIRNL